MSETSAGTIRPDIDIQSDLQALLVHYPPLAHDRHRLIHTVNQGLVTIVGYVKSRATYSYLVNNLPLISGVASIDHSQLFNDDDIRLDIGRVVPFGVFANIEYGEVKLTGSLPANTSIESLVQQVGSIPGVRRVVTVFQ